MAKDIYKIPETLDKNIGDNEIAIKSPDGVGLRPLPVKIILFWIGSIIGWFFMISKTFITSGGACLVILFTILWFVATFLLLRQDKTGEIQANLVISMTNYLPKYLRRVITRNSAKANDFYQISGIRHIDEDRGIISFGDGTFGYMYRVVGNGSILLFDDDRKAILDHVDTFFRKMKTDYELIFITTKESQKVYRQVSALNHKYKNLTCDDADLLALANTQYRYLVEYVGGTYRSIHQYMIIKADNMESLNQAKLILQNEVESSTMVFKQCVALFGDDIYDVFRSVFRK